MIRKLIGWLREHAFPTYHDGLTAAEAAQVDELTTYLPGTAALGGSPAAEPVPPHPATRVRPLAPGSTAEATMVIYTGRIPRPAEATFSQARGFDPLAALVDIQDHIATAPPPEVVPALIGEALPQPADLDLAPWPGPADIPAGGAQ